MKLQSIALKIFKHLTFYSADIRYFYVSDDYVGLNYFKKSKDFVCGKLQIFN